MAVLEQPEAEPDPAVVREVEDAKRRVREENARKILARRDGAFRDARDGPVVGPKSAAPAVPPTCPGCGKPFKNPQYKRCFNCPGASGPGRAPGPPGGPNLVPAAGPVGRVQPTFENPPAGQPRSGPSGLELLRGLVDSLAGLDDGDARWLLESAFLLSRAGRSGGG